MYCMYVVIREAASFLNLCVSHPRTHEIGLEPRARREHLSHGGTVGLKSVSLTEERTSSADGRRGGCFVVIVSLDQRHAYRFTYLLWSFVVLCCAIIR